MICLGKINTPVIDDLFIHDNYGTGIPAIPIGNFTVKLYNPAGVEVSGTIPVTIVELGLGHYRTQFTPNMVGIWMLVVYEATYAPYGNRGDYQIFAQLFDDIDIQNLGLGNRLVTVTVQDAFSLDPIAGVYVQVFNTGMTTQQAFGFTNVNGQIVFSLFDGSYKVVLTKVAQYVFTVPEDLTVAGTTAVTYQGTYFDPGTPSSPEVCIVYGWTFDIHGDPISTTVTARVVGDDNFLISDPLIAGTESSTTSDPTTGYWSMELIKSGQYASGDRTVLYEFEIGDMHKTGIIPNLPICPVADILDP